MRICMNEQKGTQKQEWRVQLWWPAEGRRCRRCVGVQLRDGKMAPPAVPTIQSQASSSILSTQKEYPDAVVCVYHPSAGGEGGHGSHLWLDNLASQQVQVQ